MTPSIIRRFAKYHGVGVVLPGESGYSLNISEQLAKSLYGPLSWGNSNAAACNIVQALTRIEAAEHAMHRASIRSFGRTDAEQNEALCIADELFAQASIDPDKWREVKE